MSRNNTSCYQGAGLSQFDCATPEPACVSFSCSCDGPYTVSSYVLLEQILDGVLQGLPISCQSASAILRWIVMEIIVISMTII